MQGTTQRLLDSAGRIIEPKGPFTIAYNADGTVATIDMVAGNNDTYRQTWTWTAGQLTGVTGWVRQ